MLQQGNLLILPTDTVYGVAAHPDVPGAEERLSRAKGRAELKPIPLLLADGKSLRNYQVITDDLMRALINTYWPGPLTLVLPVGDRWEGFRVPDHPGARAVLRAAGGALRVTSANQTGAPPALTVSEAAAALKTTVALALDAGPVRGGVPSTVLRVGPKGCVLLREGAVPRRALAELCRVWRRPLKGEA